MELRSLLGTSLMGVALLQGCATSPQATGPIAKISLAASCATRPDTLVVMLPGRATPPEMYVGQGFVATLRLRHIAADVVLADTHIGYYLNRTIAPRLYEDVLLPARAQGYKHIWLVGISAGGFGVVMSGYSHPEAIDGIVAIAPYLGDQKATEPIGAQGGLRTWHAPTGDVSEFPNDDVPVWRWLQGYADPQRAAALPALYLGYGRDDPFVYTDKLLAAVLPPERVFIEPGGHVWGPWIAMWPRMLDAMPLPHDASCAVVAGK